jgi:branched-chain amino acid aminotransferase group I
MQPELPDPRNADIVVHVGGELLHRDEAKVSVFDSSVQGGDAVWEGLRVYSGRIFQLEEHLERLRASARAMAFQGIPPSEEVRRATFETLAANSMRDGAHIRLTLTRGLKVTSGMSPEFNRSGCCLIVLAEWKAPVYPTNGVRLITAAIRRNTPQCIDSKIHHNNLINNILAKIEANVAGVDDALMLDIHGFVSETNATNVFLVRRGALLTPHADSCLPGITRAVVLQMAREDGIPIEVRNLSLSEVYVADEMFTTGTMGELTPVLNVDGRSIGSGGAGSLTDRLRTLYAEKTSREGVAIPEEAV